LKRSGLNEEAMAATTREGPVDLRSAEQVSASEPVQRKINMAKPQQAICLLFAQWVNELPESASAAATAADDQKK